MHTYDKAIQPLSHTRSFFYFSRGDVYYLCQSIPCTAVPLLPYFQADVYRSTYISVGVQARANREQYTRKDSSLSQGTSHPFFAVHVPSITSTGEESFIFSDQYLVQFFPPAVNNCRLDRRDEGKGRSALPTVGTIETRVAKRRYNTYYVAACRTAL